MDERDFNPPPSAESNARTSHFKNAAMLTRARNTGQGKHPAHPNLTHKTHGTRGKSHSSED